MNTTTATNKNEETLLKIRKGATSSLTFKAVASAIAQFGWKLEVLKKVEGPVRDCYGEPHLSKLLGALVGEDRVYVRPMIFDSDEMVVETTIDTTAIVPGAVVGEFTIASVRKDRLSAGREKQLEDVLVITLSQTGSGVRVTSPRGETFTVIKERAYKGVPNFSVFPHMVKLGLVDDTCAFLGLPTIEAERADKESTFDREDVTNTGTCPCCFGLYKLTTDGGMVHHGFTRPGIGQILGDCFGVGYQPFEVSFAGTEALRNYFANRLTHLEAHLAFLNSDACTKVRETVSEGWGRNATTKIVELVRGVDARFETILAKDVVRVTKNIEGLVADVKGLTGMITNWKAADLPEVRAARGEKLKRWGYTLISFDTSLNATEASGVEV